MDLFVKWWVNLGKKALIDLAIPFAKDNFPGLVSNTASNAVSNAINKIERKISGKRAVRARKGFILFISNEDINGIIKIVESLENSGLLIDSATETVNHEIKKQ